MSSNYFGLLQKLVTFEKQLPFVVHYSWKYKTIILEPRNFYFAIDAIWGRPTEGSQEHSASGALVRICLPNYVV